MNYIKSKVKNPYLGDIQIENFFITELMPDAPGDFVKVYFYGRFVAEHNESLSPSEMAANLGISENKILEAWDYWEEFGAIKKRYIDGEGRLDFTVEFLNLKEQLYGDPEEEGVESLGIESVIGTGSDHKQAQSAFGNEALRTLLDQIEKKLARPLSVSELQTVISWVEDTKAPPEVVLQGVDYCISKGKISFKYMTAVIEAWIEQGLDSQEKVQDYIEEYDQKFVRYRRVMQALGLSRNPTEEEKRIMDTWFDDMGYRMDRVLEACGTTAGISNPNIKYVNTVLNNWRMEATREKRDINEAIKVSNTELKEYYDYLREKADREAEERRLKVYKEIPELKTIDENMRDIGIRLAKSLLNKDDGQGANLSAELERLNEDRAIALVENGYDVNYTDPKYRCTRCNDTGLAEMGGPCDCREERRGEAEIWLRERETARQTTTTTM